MAHARLSPSSAHRWMTCPASAVLTADMPDVRSDYASEGTAAHFLASEALLGNINLYQKLYSFVLVENNGDCKIAPPKESIAGRIAYKINTDMINNVQSYLDYVQTLTRDTKGTLLVEQALPLETITGEQGAKGTSDAVILTDDELIIVDLKYGQGVRVEAEQNEQLMIYALSALAEYDMYADFKQARLVIHQPRLNHISEWTVSIDQLKAFGEQVKNMAGYISSIPVEGIDEGDYTPEEHACKFCKAKAMCPALQAHVFETVANEFDDLTDDSGDELENDRLADCYAQVNLIKDWCKAIEQAVFDKLAKGENVEGFKLVEGRAGSRKWANEEEAESLMKSMRIKVDLMYDKKIISPTSAEKLAKTDKIGSTQWGKLQELIIKPQGNPTIAPADDKRPAISLTAAADEFDDLTTQPA